MLHMMCISDWTGVDARKSIAKLMSNSNDSILSYLTNNVYNAS